VKIEAFGEVANKPLKMQHEKNMNPHTEYQSFDEFSNTYASLMRDLALSRNSFLKLMTAQDL